VTTNLKQTKPKSRSEVLQASKILQAHGHVHVDDSIILPASVEVVDVAMIRSSGVFSSDN
jgi:hypothetical protein